MAVPHAPHFLCGSEIMSEKVRTRKKVGGRDLFRRLLNGHISIPVILQRRGWIHKKLIPELCEYRNQDQCLGKGNV